MNEIAGNVIGLPRKREETIEILNLCFSRDLIELEELEVRLEKAENARSIEELDALTADVPAQLIKPEEVPVEVPDSRKKNYSIIMGSKSLPPGRLTQGTHIRVIMGSCILDFRMAKLPPGVTEIYLKNIMSSCEIIVPPGVMVENETREIMSSVQEDHILSRSNKNREKILRIKGSVIMGSVNIIVK